MESVGGDKLKTNKNRNAFLKPVEFLLLNIHFGISLAFETLDKYISNLDSNS